MIRKKQSETTPTSNGLLSQSNWGWMAMTLMIISFGAGYLFEKSALGNNGTDTSAANTNQQAAPTAAAQQQGKTAEVTMEQVRSLFGDGNITFGDKNSKLIFVEFSDPSCPFCHVAGGLNPNLNKQMGTQFLMKADGGTYVAPVPEMKKLVDSGKAAMVWLYARGHGNGELGTQALYCAHEKGKFWAVNDLLMSDSGYTMLNTTAKNDVAQAGTMANFLKNAVDSNFMKSCLESGKYAGRINSDMAIASKFGFSGTPDFYVNTTNFVGAYSFTDMQPAVTSAQK
jgi:protein-disulfide isomerase